MDAETVTTAADGIRVIALPAGIDQDTAGDVRAALTRALAAGATVVVVDMTATTCCTLEGIQALLRSRRAAETAGAQLRLAAVRPEVQRLLEMTGTIRLLRPYPTLEAAPDGKAPP